MNQSFANVLINFDWIVNNLIVAICKPRHWNLDIGIRIGIGTDTTNAIISSSIWPMDTKPSWMVI